MSLYVDIEKKLGSFCLQVKLEAGDETLALLGASVLVGIILLSVMLPLMDIMAAIG